MIGQIQTSTWNDGQMSQLKDRIHSLNSNRYSLLDSFDGAMKSTGLHYYQFEQKIDRQSLECLRSVIDIDGEEETHFTYNQQINGIRKREIGTQMILGKSLDYHWRSATVVSGVRVQNLVISLSGIGKLSLKILNEKTIMCSFLILRFNDNEEYDEIHCTEYIHSSSPLDIHQGTTSEDRETFPSSSMVSQVVDEDDPGSLIYLFPILEDKEPIESKFLKSEYLNKSREMLYRIRLNG
jgi:hypothetical protein